MFFKKEADASQIKEKLTLWALKTWVNVKNIEINNHPNEFITILNTIYNQGHQYSSKVNEKLKEYYICNHVYPTQYANLVLNKIFETHHKASELIPLYLDIINIQFKVLYNEQRAFEKYTCYAMLNTDE